MWIRTLILGASILFAGCAFADTAAYNLIKGKSSLKFYIINNDAPVEGQFKDFVAEINFDRENPENSKIKVTVDMKSLSSGSSDVEKTLQEKSWLAVADFPKAVFTSKKITKMPYSDDYYGDGQLQLKGKTLPVGINFSIKFADDKTAVANGYVTLRRKDYGIGQGEWAKDDVLKNEVRVEFRVVAEKK